MRVLAVIRKIANELWAIPTVVLVSLLVIETVHTQAHYSMEEDVHSYCRNLDKH